MGGQSPLIDLFLLLSFPDSKESETLKASLKAPGLRLGWRFAFLGFKVSFSMVRKPSSSFMLMQ